MPDTDPKLAAFDALERSHAAWLAMLYSRIDAQKDKETAMDRPQQLKVSASTACKGRLPLHHFQPGDVVEGGETGRLYLVIHGPGHGQVGHRVLFLDGANRWHTGPTQGTFRAVEHAQLDIRRASR